MAEWKYLTKSVQLKNQDIFKHLEEVLHEYGEKGWELVQVLPPSEGSTYHLIFKIEKPIMDSEK
jgi:hypothetical protein